MEIVWIRESISVFKHTFGWNILLFLNSYDCIVLIRIFCTSLLSIPITIASSFRVIAFLPPSLDARYVVFSIFNFNSSAAP